jgi:hypothetical protein
MTAGLKGPPHRYTVDLLVDPRRLDFEAMPDGQHQAALEFTLVAFGPDGQRVNYLDHAIALHLKPEEYTQIITTGIHVRLPIDLPAGQNSLRVAVHDLAAARAGSLEAPVAVAAR